MGEKNEGTSRSLVALLEEHNATNAAVKVAAVAMNRLFDSPPEDEREFATAMGGWIKAAHTSWGAAQLTRNRIPNARDWLASAALVRALASFEAYGDAAATKLSVSPATDEGDDADKMCRSVRNSLAASHQLSITTDELSDLCEVVNWCAAIRNAVCHGNQEVVSGRRPNAQHAWSRIHKYFGFADKADVPTFPKEIDVTWPLVLLASACGYRIAQRLDAAICAKHGTNW